jgi:hypothetical protein
MPQTVPSQHPAVVLRSHYRHLRTLLAIAMVAVVGLSVAVVILADDDPTGTRSATPVSARTESADGPRYVHSPGQRYDPGPRGTVPTQPREPARSPQPQPDGATDTPPSSPERHQKPGLNGPGMRR